MAKSDFGKGSLKRHLAAVKAADTKRKNAALRKKERQIKTLPKFTNEKAHHEIASFVKNNLISKIIDDLKHHLISTEGDLQSALAYHLREFLKDQSNLRLSTQITFRLKKRDPIFIADIVISKIIPTFSQMEPLVIIELKEHPELLPDFEKDIEKLQHLRNKKVMKFGFLIYLVRSKYAENVLQEEVDNFVRQKFKDRIIPIIIDIYNHLTAKEKIKFDKRWEQTKRYELDKATAKKAARTRKRKRSAGKKSRRKKRSEIF